MDTTNWPLNTRVHKTKDENVLKVIGIFDPHMSWHNPPVYKVDYWANLKETLRTVFRFAKSNQVDAILFAGDLFHLKTASRNPLSFMAEVINLFREPQLDNIIVAGIAGNHDVLFGNIEKGFDGQPISLLEAAGVYQLLDKEELLFTMNGHSVRIAGESYRHAQAVGCRDKKKKGADRLISVGHFWFGQQSGEFFGEPIYGPDFLGSGEPDIYMIGHHHEDQGIREIAGKHYDSHGSLSRTGSHANDLERRPAASYMEVSPAGIKTQLLRPKCGRA